MKKLLLGIALLFSLSHTHASFISADATLVNGNQLVINYEVTANEFDLTGFTVFFDALLFDNITVTGSPSGGSWTSFVAQSIVETFIDGTEPFIDDGFVDFFNEGSSLLVGQMAGMFQITVDIIDGSTPATISQLVEFYNDVDFTFGDPFSFTVENAEVSSEELSSPSIFNLFALIVFVLTVRHVIALRISLSKAFSIAFNAKL